MRVQSFGLSFFVLGPESPGGRLVLGEYNMNADDGGIDRWICKVSSASSVHLARR